MNDKLTVAVIVKPQGIRGEVKIKVLCDGAEDLEGLKRVFIDGAEYGIFGFRGQGDIACTDCKAFEM